MQHGPLKAQRPGLGHPDQLLTNEDRDGRRIRSTLHPNTKLSTSSHAQRSASTALIPDPRNQQRYSSARAPRRPPAPAHCSPAPLRRRLGGSVVDCACALRPAPLLLGTAPPAAPAHCSPAPLLQRPDNGIVNCACTRRPQPGSPPPPSTPRPGGYLGPVFGFFFFFAFSLPGFRNHMVSILLVDLYICN